MILPYFVCTYHPTAQGIHLIVLLFSELTITGLNNKDLVVVCLRIAIHCNLNCIVRFRETNIIKQSISRHNLFLYPFTLHKV